MEYNDVVDAAKQSNMDVGIYMQKAGIREVDDNYSLQGKSFSAKDVLDAATQSNLGFDDYIQKAGFTSEPVKKKDGGIGSTGSQAGSVPSTSLSSGDDYSGRNPNYKRPQDIFKVNTTATPVSKNISPLDFTIKQLGLPSGYIKNNDGIVFPIINNDILGSTPEERERKVDELRNGINRKALSPQDIQVVSKMSGKSVNAVAAYVSGDPKSGAAIESQDKNNMELDALKNGVAKVNSMFNLNFNPDEIFTSAEKTATFLNGIKDLTRKEIERRSNAQKTKQAENFNMMEAESMFPTPIEYTKDEQDLSPQFIKQVEDYSKQLQTHIVNKTVDEDVTNGVAKEETIDKIYKRINPEDYAANKATETTNPLTLGWRAAMDYLVGSDNKEKNELLTAHKGVAELEYNNALESVALNKISKGITQNDAALQQEGKLLYEKVENNDAILQRYPSLMKRQMAQEVSDAFNQESGVAEGSDINNIKGFVTGADIFDYARIMKAKGWFDDPNKRSIAMDLLSHPSYFQENSLLGSVGKNFLQPFKDLGMSIADIAGIRSSKDIYSDRVKDELFPQESNKLKWYVSAPRTVFNTSANLLGYMAIASMTEGVGAEVGLASRVSKGMGAFTSFGLPSYDHSLQEAQLLMPNNSAGQHLYASLNATLNTAGALALDLPAIIRNPAGAEFAQLVKGVSEKNITRDAAKELIDKGVNKYLDFTKKYVAHTTKGAAVMTGFNVKDNLLKIAFGDEDAENKLLPQAGQAFLHGLLGMSVIGAFGAKADMSKEANSSFKSVIYKSVLNPDATKSILELGVKQGNLTPEEFNNKVQIVNTGIVANNLLTATEASSGIQLTEGQRAVYVANKTAEAVFREKAKNTVNETEKKQLLEQADRLAEQSVQTLDGLQFTEHLKPLYSLYNSEKEFKKSQDEFYETPTAETEKNLLDKKASYESEANDPLPKGATVVKPDEISQSVDLTLTPEEQKTFESLPENERNLVNQEFENEQQLTTAYEQTVNGAGEKETGSKNVSTEGNGSGGQNRGYSSLPDTKKTELLKSVDDYREKHKADFPIPEPTPTVVKLNPERSKSISEAYDKLPDNDSANPEVKTAYDQLGKEVQTQYDFLTKDLGIKVDFTESDPYVDSKSMVEDVANNKHLSVYKGGGDHPFLGEHTADENGVTLNEKFRAIHDYFGHATEGNQFGKNGEEAAWVAHSKMFSPEAQKAMTTETRGQNSWVNFSGINDAAIKKISDAHKLILSGDKEAGEKLLKEGQEEFQFAKQKVALLPPEFHSFEDYKDISKASGGKTGTSEPATNAPSKVGKYEAKAKTIADKINSVELPQWLVNTDPTIVKQGVDIGGLKSALADAVVHVGRLLDKGVEFKDALKEAADNLVEFYKKGMGLAEGAKLKPEFENQLRTGFEGYVKDNIPPTETKPDGATEPADNGNAITHESTSDTRKEFDLGEYKKIVVSDAELNKRADDAIEKGYDVNKLIERLQKGELPSSLETVILKKYKPILEEEARQNPTDENLSRLYNLVRASDVARSDVGRTLRLGQDVEAVGIDMSQHSLGDFYVAEMESHRVTTLTPEQKAEVEKRYTDLKDAYDAMQKKLNSVRSQLSREKANKNVQETKKYSTKTPKTHTEHVEYRNQLKQRLKEAKEKAEKDLSDRGIHKQGVSFTLNGEMIKIIGDIVKDHVVEGVEKLEEISKRVLDDIKEVFPSVTKDDVVDIIAGVYNEPKKTKSSISETMFNLKMEAQLIKKMEKLQSGTDTPVGKNKIKRTQEIEDLRSKIKDFRTEKAAAERQQKDAEKTANKRPPDEIALESLKKRIRTQIDKLKDDLRTGNFSEPEKKQPLKLDQEAIDLKDRYIHLKMEEERRRAKAEYDSRSRVSKFKTNALELLNAPRTLMSSTDFSAPLRQGLIPTISHPILASKAAVEMFRQSVSQKRFDRWLFDLKESLEYKVMEESKLYISDPHNIKLSAKEEAFMNNIVERIPVIGTMLVKGSERAYVSYLNKMRVDLFSQGTRVLEMQGRTPENSPEHFKALASWVNNSTGRGGMSNAMELASPLLSATFFSPRLIASRLNLLGLSDVATLGNGFYGKLPKEVRIMAIKDMAKMLAFGASVVALSKLWGADVETDSRSSDFGKIKVGDTRYDIWGGFQQYIRVASQLISGSTKSTRTGKIYDLSGKGLFGKTRLDVGTAFLRGKLAPVPSMIMDFSSGRTMVGEKILYQWGGDHKEGKEITLKDMAISHFLPMVYSDVSDAIKEQGAKAIFSTWLPATFGVGVQTYDSDQGRTIKNVPNFK